MLQTISILYIFVLTNGVTNWLWKKGRDPSGVSKFRGLDPSQATSVSHDVINDNGANQGELRSLTYVARPGTLWWPR
jgi:hypothetical protein